MSQPSVSAYFNSRKRSAVDELSSHNVKKLMMESNVVGAAKQLQNDPIFRQKVANIRKNLLSTKSEEVAQVTTTTKASSSKRVTNRAKKASSKTDCKQQNIKDVFANLKCKSSTIEDKIKQTSTKSELPSKGTDKDEEPTTPTKMAKMSGEGLDTVLSNIQKTPIKTNAFVNKDVERKTEDCERQYPTTPTKPLVINPPLSTMDKMASGDINKLSIAQIKAKLTRSSRLAELKASLDKVNNMAKKIEEAEGKLKMKNDQEKKKLQQFNTIEIEVPMSPSKQNILRTPEKPYLSPVKKPSSVRKNLFGSPVKSNLSSVSPIKSPSKLAAYQRFAHLTATDQSKLILPYKYRNLAKIFKAIDEICAMLYKKQVITFTKLKSAVQESLRQTLTELHLEQIKHIYPDAYKFSQEKIRHFGSGLNDEKYELVVTPILTSTETNVCHEDKIQNDGNNVMSLPVLAKRQRKLYNLLVEKTKDYHQEFLKACDPPIAIKREDVLRWHPEFDLDQVPDIDRMPLPQPPNTNKITSAKDMLLRAKSLFNCNTKMEAALQRLAEVQAKREAEKLGVTETLKNESAVGKSSDSTVKSGEVTARSDDLTALSSPNQAKMCSLDCNTNDSPAIPVINEAKLPESVLKGIPKSLLEKVRARQAAKALEAMTRDPVREKEAAQFAQLPDLAKFLRNIFITEKKNVLPMEMIVNKLNNSFRTSLRSLECEELLRLLAKSVPEWMTLCEVRKSMFIKLNKTTDMTKVISKLESMSEARQC